MSDQTSVGLAGRWGARESNLLPGKYNVRMIMAERLCSLNRSQITSAFSRRAPLLEEEEREGKWEGPGKGEGGKGRGENNNNTASQLCALSVYSKCVHCTV